MTGAHLSVASRRADGLATSAVLDQKYLPHAIETTRRRFEPIRFPPLAGETSEGQRGHKPLD